MLLKITVFTQN